MLLDKEDYEYMNNEIGVIYYSNSDIISNFVILKIFSKIKNGDTSYIGTILDLNKVVDINQLKYNITDIKMKVLFAKEDNYIHAYKIDCESDENQFIYAFTLYKGMIFNIENEFILNYSNLTKYNEYMNLLNIKDGFELYNRNYEEIYSQLFHQVMRLSLPNIIFVLKNIYREKLNIPNGYKGLNKIENTLVYKVKISYMKSIERVFTEYIKDAIIEKFERFNKNIFNEEYTDNFIKSIVDNVSINYENILYEYMNDEIDIICE